MPNFTLLYGIVVVGVGLVFLPPAYAQHQAQDEVASGVATPIADQVQEPPQSCRAILAALPFTIEPNTATSELTGRDCLVRHIRFGTGKSAYLVDSLRLHGFTSDFDTFPDLVPDRSVAVRVEARGITFSPQISDPKLMWMIGQQQVPFDVTLDASYDPTTRRATLDEFTLDGDVLGHVQLRLMAGEIPAARPPDLFGKGGLMSLHLDLDSRGFLTGFALSPLLPLLPDDDPGGAVEAVKREAVGGIRALLPQADVSATTTDALVGFVADFPHPKHPFTIDISAVSPVTANVIEAASSSPARLMALLRLLTISARYTGAFR
ncbi:hypothetical protein [Acidisoma cladoniae]|jgi:hypothetical protein|uniref:hypothetical protein n=1 Tax=Acidisoma cladoniae TaxID=3040935 RepID=UPI00254B043E|nr:hypothetical protein [Acidisoma sp. PAMC 29798]